MGGKDDGGGDHRARQGTATGFIDAGNKPVLSEKRLIELKKRGKTPR